MGVADLSSRSDPLRFIPPHIHIGDIRQLSSGLYGPLIVLERGQLFDPVMDKIMLLSVLGPSDNTPIMFNGSVEPKPIELKQGIKYRFRFINITPHDPRLTVSLLSGSSLVNWRAIAKDGADLPSSLANLRPARQIVSVGETYDFEFEPTSQADLRLEIFRSARVGERPSFCSVRRPGDNASKWVKSPKHLIALTRWVAKRSYRLRLRLRVIHARAGLRSEATVLRLKA